MSDRDSKLFIAQVLDVTDRRREMANLMNEVVAMDPVLSADERSLLALSYRELVTVHRDGLRRLADIAKLDSTTESQQKKLAEIRDRVIADLCAGCNELIELVDTKLLPAAVDAQSRVFCQKLKADHYRYICEACGNQVEAAEKAKASYLAALEIAKMDIPRYQPEYVGLIMNYSVFLYEVLVEHDKALEVANAAIAECAPQISGYDDGQSTEEASLILQLLRDNVTLWSEQSQ